MGFGFCPKALSRAILTVVSMEVRFFRRRPMLSADESELQNKLDVFKLLSASSNHFCSKGFNLHIFLNERFNASKREMVVCEKSFPYILPMAKPTSP